MKNLACFSIIICLLFMAGCSKEQPVSSVSYEVTESDYDIVMKRDILCLMMGYPEYITGVERKPDESIYIIMKSGTAIIYDDKKSKNYQQKINSPDLQDMMEQIYPLCDINELMPEEFDPGRFRVYALFKEVYGSSKQQIQSNLTTVSTAYGNLQFNKNNGASDALKSALGEVLSLARNNKSIYSFIYPAGGTFNYRFIAGTSMLSFHSFGTAIDLASNKRDYWKWATREQGQKVLSAYPCDVVKAFEKHNFIWGGKWGHFDMMHYEYRPELVLKARYFPESPKPGEVWHRDLFSANSQIAEYIQIIDNSLS